MLIPYGTDAPIYHFPWGTIGLIAANIAIFVSTGAGDLEGIHPYVLTYGDGYHPSQWITANFIHGNIPHLAGNMIFLWGFGLVVEGKLGWWRFLPVYLGIGAAQCLLMQTIMLGADAGGQCGASAAIFGLLAIALVWAPENELNCIWTFRLGMWGGQVLEIPIILFCTFYLGSEMVFAWLYGWAVTSELLHLTGAAIGFAVGILMLRLQWVDCEGWDLLSRWRKSRVAKDVGDLARSVSDLANGRGNRRRRRTHRLDEMTSLERELSVKVDPGEAPAVPRKSLRQLRECLAAKNGAGALAAWQRIRRLTPDWQLSESDLRGFIDVLQQEQHWKPCVSFMQQYIERFPESAASIQLRLAKILITELDRPRRGLRLLEDIPEQTLDGSLAAARERLRQLAEEKCVGDEIELSDDL